MKNTFISLVSLLVLILFSACSGEEENFEVTLEKSVNTEEALINKISDDILIYTDRGINVAIDDELSITNYPYLFYAFIHNFFSDEDIIAGQFAENLNNNITKEGMLAIVDTNVKLYKQQNNVKEIKGSDITVLRNKISNSKNNIEKDEALIKIKDAITVELVDAAMNIAEILFVTLVLFSAIRLINSRIEASYDKQCDIISNTIEKTRKQEGLFRKFVTIIEGCADGYSNMQEIKRLEKKKERLHTAEWIIDIVVLVISIFIISGISADIQNDTKDKLAETYINVIINASGEAPADIK